MNVAIRNHQRGAALITTMLVMVLLSALGMSTLQTVTRDRQVAGHQKRSMTAFYAAEAGVARAREVIRDMGGRGQLPSYPADFPNQGTPVVLADAGDFHAGQPSFYADPVIVTPIGYDGEGSACSEGCDMKIGGIKYNHTRWRINVVGRSPEGDTARIEVMATRLLAVGY